MATGDRPGVRRALLVAADDYADPALTRLRGPVGDVAALADVLGDETLGGFEVRRVVNRPTEETKREIESFFEDARPGDLLLLYMSGHGVLSQTRRFYFATASTELKWLRATAIEDTFVNDVMHHSRARSIVLIVDCCHSGAFARGLTPKSAPTVDVVPRFDGRGRVTLTASTELEYAFEDTGAGASVSELGAAQPGSIFTRFVVEGIRTGDADANRDGQISIDELYDFVYTKVREHSPHQTPGKGGGGHGDLVIASSAREASVGPELRQALDSPLAGAREAAVGELGRMRASASPAMGRAIDTALREMLDDDSRRVRDAAATALGETSATTPPSTASSPAATAAGESPATPPPATAGTRQPVSAALRGRRLALAGVVAVVLAGAGVAAIVAFSGSGGSGGSGKSSTTALPPNPGRGTELGSDLTPTGLDTCLGPNETCSVVQYALRARPTIASSDGVITRWAMRGQGRVALQVVTLTPTGATAVAQSNFVTVAPGAPQHFRTRLPITKGQFIALLMCPGARIAQSSADGNADLRWDQGLPVGRTRSRSEMDPETKEYTFNASIDVHGVAPSSSVAQQFCPS